MGLLGYIASHTVVELLVNKYYVKVVDYPNNFLIETLAKI